MNNKLYCTFCEYDQIGATIEIIKNRYAVLYNKIFILESQDNKEYICTYNIDIYNTNGSILENTILTHRKKEVNVLYTINALNILIKELNNGVLDKNYKIDWNNYKNSILLTQQDSFKKLNTKIYKIISL